MKFTMIVGALALAGAHGAAAAATFTVVTTGSGLVTIGSGLQTSEIISQGCPFSGDPCASVNLVEGVPVTAFTHGVSFGQRPTYDTSFSGEIGSFDFTTAYDVDGHSFNLTQHFTLTQISNQQFQFNISASAPTVIDLGGGGLLQATANSVSGQFMGGGVGGGQGLRTTFVLLAPSVPEPATWSLLIAGFGLVGTTLRTRRRYPALTQ